MRTTSLSSPTLQKCNGDTTAADAVEEEGHREGEKKETQMVHITSGEKYLVCEVLSLSLLFY